MQNSATRSSKLHLNGNTRQSRLLHPWLASVFLSAIVLFSATGQAQVSPIADEVSVAASVVVADNFETEDGSDPMGSSHSWMSFNPPYFEYKGWFDPETYELRTVAPSSTLQVFDLIPAD